MSIETENTYPSQFRIFKKRSAMRLQLDKPNRAGQKYEVGCIFLQVAPAKDGDGVKNGYEWEHNKISVKLGFNDISSIIHGIKCGTEVSLYHTFNDDSKRIMMSPKDGGGFFINIEQNSKGVKSSVAVPLSDQEVGSFMTMLSFALPLIHNWI